MEPKDGLGIETLCLVASCVVLFLELIVAVIAIGELSNLGQFEKSDSGGLVATLTISFSSLA